MLLEGMTDTGDISVDFIAIGQTNTGNFPQCRVGLLGRCGKNTQAHSPPLRALGQIWRTASRLLGLTTLAYQLLNCRHATSASCFARRDPAASFTISFRAVGLFGFWPLFFTGSSHRRLAFGFRTFRVTLRPTPETRIHRARVSVTKGAEKAGGNFLSAHCTTAQYGSCKPRRLQALID